LIIKEKIAPEGEKALENKNSYIVVIFVESLFVGMDPVNWFQLRSLQHHNLEK
jgi:hypothetical protein